MPCPISKRITQLLYIVLLSAVFPCFSEIRSVDCRQLSPNRYAISFVLDGDSHSVQIFGSAQPGPSDLGRPLATSVTGKVEVTAGNPGERIYFFLKPDHGKTQEVSIRRLPLQGAINFRDLGGYPTTDGQSVRWGVIYRSSELGHLTEGDLVYLKQLQVRLICDFRTEEERKHLADRWPDAPVAESLSYPVGGNAGGQSASLAAFQRLIAQDPRPEKLHGAMISLYSEMAIDGASEFNKAMQQIVNGRLPFLYHCTAGKDRTGLFSAFLLRVLGVGPDAVMADYLLSNQYLLSPEVMARMQTSVHAAAPNMPVLSPEAMRVLMGVDEQYLTAAFKAIDEKYGSFDNYRRTALNISDSNLSQLRSHLLTP